MTVLRFLPAVFVASAVLSIAPLASAVVAPAPEPTPSGCTTNQECGRGYECTVVGSSSCAPSAACAPGASCPTPEPCTQTEVRACTPAHCTVDADCADGMICHEWTAQVAMTGCACPSDMPDCTCADPTAPADPPASEKLCTPRYVLPCTTAADCGDGFTCEELQSCGCAGSSGGGATPGGTPSMAPLPPDGAAGASSSDVAPPDCNCQPSGDFACVVKPVTCQVDTECAAGWHCIKEVTVGTSPACPPNMNCPAPEPAPMPTSGTCQPPYYGAQSGSDLETPTTSTSGSGTTKGGTSGSTNNGSGGGTTTGGTPAPEANAGDGASHESAACQFGRAPVTQGAFGLLAVLGALAGLSRRRRAQG